MKVVKRVLMIFLVLIVILFINYTVYTCNQLENTGGVTNEQEEIVDV